MRAAVLGHPIAHSLSPVLHRAAYQACGLADWRYDAFDVAEAGLAGCLAGLEPGEWAGLSLTRPLKQVALDLVDHVEPLAAAVGAVNTVLFCPGGSVGANTDVFGMVQAIKTRDAGPHPAGQLAQEPGTDHAGSRQATPVAPRSALGFTTATILGGGATAASALAAVGQLGVTEPSVWVRSLARSAELIKAAARMGVVPGFHLWPSGPAPATGAAAPAAMSTGQATVPPGHPVATGPPGHPADRGAISQDPVIQPGTQGREPWHAADLVICTLPAGAADPLAVDLTGRDLTGKVLLDVAYHPWPTPLAQAWANAGGQVVSGLDMLLYQAAEQFRLMTGQPAPIQAMRAALREHANVS